MILGYDDNGHAGMLVCWSVRKVVFLRRSTNVCTSDAYSDVRASPWRQVSGVSWSPMKWMRDGHSIYYSRAAYLFDCFWPQFYTQPILAK